jgi:predicted lactoylglutathione lyase/uncharacterized protein YndB with AHSA1/START domain
MSRAANDTTERDLVLSRDLDAPRERVWQAWTQPHRLAQWWGPEGFRTRVEALDLRPGGRWRYVMVGPDGAGYPSVGVFREIVPFERIVSTDEFGDDFEGQGLDLPIGIVATTLFEDLPGGRTRVTQRIAHPDAEERRKHEAMGVVPGWQSSFDCLDAHLRATRGGCAGLADADVALPPARKLFVNLPVHDLERSIGFFTKLGLTFDPRFTDESATCMLIGQDAYAMLLVRDRFRDFTGRDLCDTRRQTEGIFALSCTSRAEVDRMAESALDAGGARAVAPQDHGFMYERSFYDPDGHHWTVFWMDPEAVDA